MSRNAWTDHVKSVAARRGISYKNALSVAGATYKRKGKRGGGLAFGDLFEFGNAMQQRQDEQQAGLQRYFENMRENDPVAWQRVLDKEAADKREYAAKKRQDQRNYENSVEGQFAAAFTAEGAQRNWDTVLAAPGVSQLLGVAATGIGAAADAYAPGSGRVITPLAKKLLTDSRYTEKLAEDPLSTLQGTYTGAGPKRARRPRLNRFV